jgi:hypothetical protein
MTLSEYLRGIFGPHWAICRNTERNRERHGVCITHKQYRIAVAGYTFFPKKGLTRAS